MLLKAGQYSFSFPRPAIIMGILNVTPDSFSDGGKYSDQAAAVARAYQLKAEGAEILDIGGESTRPGAEPVATGEELRRTLPVIEALAGEIGIPISIDTMKPEVAREALKAGACMVNDVAANREDNGMWRVVAEAEAGYVCMHMQGSPATMQGSPAYQDVAGEVAAFFTERLGRLRGCGIALEQIILDPGIGFGKTAAHNLQLLGKLGEFVSLGRPVMLGVSRKSFLGKPSGAGVTERLPEALACTALAVEAGVQIIRTHDVAETLRAARMTEAVLSANKKNNGAALDPKRLA